MTDLSERRCEACRPDSPVVDSAQCAEFLQTLPGWEIRREGRTPILARSFRFADFAMALEFANAVGALADAEDHHPRLVIEWGRVEVAWWTHVIGGLHLNDFILAARTDALATGG